MRAQQTVFRVVFTVLSYQHLTNLYFKGTLTALIPNNKTK